EPSLGIAVACDLDPRVLTAHEARALDLEATAHQPELHRAVVPQPYAPAADRIARVDAHALEAGPPVERVELLDAAPRERDATAQHARQLLLGSEPRDEGREIDVAQIDHAAQRIRGRPPDREVRVH